MQHRFSEVPNVEIPRSTFERSHGLKTTFDSGYLVPIFIDEALPGDTFKLNMHSFGRISTPSLPIMDNMIIDTFFFAVPNRLVWNNWVKFCGEQVDPGDSIEYSIPTIEINNISNETLFDYFGLPTQVGSAYDVSNLAGRSYNLIWNEWFRDENLQDSVTVDKDDGPDDIADYVLLKRGKRHDYFTSSLPWLQKGDSVTMVLGTFAPVVGIGKNNANFIAGVTNVRESDGDARTYDYEQEINPSPADNSFYIEGTALSGYPKIQADLAQATTATINELRQSFQIQRLLERDARSGTRYTEIIKSHFGVTSPDARLQRPEYLGGGTSVINVSPIPRTDSSPGELGAMGTFSFNNHGFVKSFTEHSTVIGLACVRADLNYQEGTDRMWKRSTRYDFYWPTLAHLGEQAVLNEEIFTSGGSNDGAVFGYQERFAEYRYKNSRVCGKMRSNDAASLDAYHLAIEFGTLPTLDDTFIQENPPLDRCIVVPTEPHFIMDAYFEMECTRPMPLYSIPGLVDHF